jgi:hypothetical protein
MSAAQWALIGLELAKTEREALKAVSETFDALRQRLQIAAIESDSGVLATVARTEDDETDD